MSFFISPYGRTKTISTMEELGILLTVQIKTTVKIRRRSSHPVF